MKKLLNLILGFSILHIPIANATTKTFLDDFEKPSGQLLDLPDNSGLEWSQQIIELVKIVSNIILGVVAAIAILGIIISAIQMILAKGIDEKLQDAKKRLQASIIGLVVAILAVSLITITVNELNKNFPKTQGTNNQSPE